MKFRLVSPPVVEETDVVVTARVFGVGDFDAAKLEGSKLGGATIKSWSPGTDKSEFVFRLPLHPARHWKANAIVILDLKQGLKPIPHLPPVNGIS